MQEGSRKRPHLGCQKSKSSSQNGFDQKVVGASGDTNTDPEIEFPIWAEVIVDCRDDLMLLKIERIEPSNVTHLPVILETHLELPGSTVAGFEIGRKRKP